MKKYLNQEIYEYVSELAYTLNFQKYLNKSIAPIPEIAFMTSTDTRRQFLKQVYKKNLTNASHLYTPGATPEDCFTFYIRGIKFHYFAIEGLNDDECTLHLYKSVEIVYDSIYVNFHHMIEIRILNDDMSISTKKYRSHISIWNFKSGEISKKDPNSTAASIMMSVAASGCQFKVVEEPRASPWDYSVCVLSEDYYKYVFWAMPFYAAMRCSKEYYLELMYTYIDRLFDEYVKV